jgi:trans-2,3-dihydro-3-hydroxyanthranilate isomerase
MGLRFDIVDVFTDRAFAGNPLAVVHRADTLSARQMQAIVALPEP